MNGRTLAPEQQMRSLRLIWTVLLFSPFLLLGVFHFVRTTSDESGAHPEMVVPLLAISCVMAVVSPLTGRFLESAMIRGAREQQPPPQPVATLAVVTVVRSALGEAAAIQSAVTYFLTGSPWAFVPFGVGLAAVLWARPTEERFDAFYRELGRPAVGVRRP